MPQRRVIAGAIAVSACCSLGAGTAVAGDPACARAASIADTATLRMASESVLCLVNGERAARGLAPVSASRELTRSAQRHSRDMVARRYFSHVSPSGANVQQRARRTGYVGSRRHAKVGETIAWGSESLATPAELVKAFMRSPGHRRILLDRGFRDVGIGFVLGAPVDAIDGVDDSATLTLDFGRRR